MQGRKLVSGQSQQQQGEGSSRASKNVSRQQAGNGEKQQPAERVSIALPFGSAIHCAIERYHRSIMDNGAPDPLWQTTDVFTEVLTDSVARVDVPIIYKQQNPNLSAAIDMGRKMLRAFYYGIDMTGLTVIGVELPLMARLYSIDGESLEMVVTGTIDLLIKDAAGNLIAVDNKTAKNPYPQTTVDEGGPAVDGVCVPSRRQSVRVPHVGCLLPFRCPTETQNAQVRAALHDPDSGTAAAVRQGDCCRALRHRGTHIHAEQELDV